MKKFYVILCIAIASLTQLQAQAPQGFNYQATVRNSAGDLIVNTNVYFKFNVMQGSQTAVPIFTETHYVPTDDLGQVNLIIGQGTANTGTFSELDWSLGSYYLGIELDTGSGYVAMGTTQLLSVPYALYAENSGNNTPTTPTLQSVLAENNSANNQQIKDLQDPIEAQDAVTKAYVDTEVSNNVQNIEQVLTQGNDANGIQLKGIADPTDAQDAVTKNYADNIISSFGYQQWSNNQVWNDNTTISPEPNSFWFINAENTTITLPPISNEGDVIKIYYMGAGVNNTTETSNQWEGFYTNIDAQSNGVIIGYFGIIEPYNEGFHYASNEIIPFKLVSGLNTFIQIGDYWMLGEAVPLPPYYVDNDNDGYTENQGDCDDANAQVNPGATELEDGVDNDCDGDIDEGFGCSEVPDLPDQTVAVCSDQALGIDFGPSSSVAATSYNIIYLELNGLSVSGGGASAISGLSASDLSDDAFTNTTSSAVDVVYTVVPVTSDGCEGDAFTVTVTVDAEPFIPDQVTTVSSDSPLGIPFYNSESGYGDGFTYNVIALQLNGLTVSAGGASIEDGLAANDLADDAFNNASDSPVDVVYTVMPVSSSGCEGNIFTVTATIEPTSDSGTVTDIDGNTYDYLTYGDQVWTVENAEMVTYRDGTEIPQVTDPTQWSNLTTGAWCYYNNDPTKPRLYNWYAVMGIHDTDPNTPNKEFAPEGWHVPSDAEWTTLEEYLIANGYNYDGTTTGNKIAKAMASTIGWNISPTLGSVGNDQSLNNSSGFNAFPEGQRTSDGSFGGGGSGTPFWSSSEDTNSSFASGRLINFDSYFVIVYTPQKLRGFSVRFVRD